MNDNCEGYILGDFLPLSFEPKLQWKLSKFARDADLLTHLTKEFRFKAVFDGHIIYVCSHPFSYGEFTVECNELQFGGKYYWLGTKDPEEALFLAERELFEWAKRNADFYNKIVNILS